MVREKYLCPYASGARTTATNTVASTTTLAADPTAAATPGTDPSSFHKDYNERHRMMLLTMDKSTIIQSGYVYRKCSLPQSPSTDTNTPPATAAHLDSAQMGVTAMSNAMMKRGTINHAPAMGSQLSANQTPPLFPMKKALKVWKKRWVVLRSHALAFYKDEKEYELKELVLLENVCSVSLLAVMKKRRNVLVLKMLCGTHYYLELIPKHPGSLFSPHCSATNMLSPTAINGHPTSDAVIKKCCPYTCGGSSDTASPYDPVKPAFLLTDLKEELPSNVLPSHLNPLATHTTDSSISASASHRPSGVKDGRPGEGACEELYYVIDWLRSLQRLIRLHQPLPEIQQEKKRQINEYVAFLSTFSHSNADITTVHS